MARKNEKYTVKKFNKISIGLASPESILEISKGEVLKPETINYRTHKPERDGLFCERIFGPVKDYECACGKYKRIRYKGIVCDRCGVEVTEKKVRRDRVGHINLVVPVAHIWYFRSLPNKMGYLLGLPSKKLDMIIYYERYVVIQPGIAKNIEGEPLQKMDFLTEEEYLDILETLPQENMYLDDSDPNKFIAKMGAECLIELLARIDLDELSYELRHKANTETSKQRKAEALKRLNVVEAFRDSQKNRENKPEWMIMKVVPVIPPELRPLVPLDGGRFATSDLNDLYRRVIIRNNRLKRLMEIKAPEVILRNEKRMLQESVDSLFDNTRKSSAVKTESNRPLKSLSDSLKGKQGRFRQNLLGKRVDYSARSVIVVGPELKLSECGIPKDMAAELYKPFVIRKLIERGIVKTVKSAKKIIDRKEPVVWDILENVIKGHPVLLNRAPTLHRLGIQAFQPKLIEGKAIQLHPLVCTAFNADFDGDQMAVHLPLGPEAILEAQLLMLASHNILNPANGAPITVPSQDMVLGLYYMTKERKSTKEVPVKGEGLTFYSPEEVTIAFNEEMVELNAGIKVRTYDIDEEGNSVKKIIQTTVGRVLFNEVVPEAAGYINEVLTKKSLRGIIGNILKATDIPATGKFLDEIKNMGYKFAFQGGLSFSLGDIIIPEEKGAMIAEANKEVDGIVMNYNMGMLTQKERYNQVIDIWGRTNNQLTELDISGNPIIYSLIVNNNELTSIDLSNQEVALDHFDASNNNLTFLNFKNGIDDSEYFFTFDLNGVILFENNPNLNFICADVFELNAIQLVAEASGIMNFSLNSYCSFEPGGDFYTVEGNTRIDFDSNGCDIDDGVASNLNFSITNGAETGNFISNDSGFYSIPVQAGIHTITPNLENLNYFDVTPSSIAVDFPTDTSPFMQDFCITPNGTFNDLEITIIPLQAARPGFDTDYKLIYKNKGTTTLSGSVDLSFEDDLMDFVSVSPTEDAQAANMLIWNFTDLNPFESRVILFTMNINSPMDTPPVNGDEVLAFGATINSSETDETPDDNTSTLNQTVVNSFDPNDKTCLEGDFITPDMVGDYVNYMIRFENTGTASAVNIVVKDDIDRTKYDLSSLTAIDASHDFVARIKDDGSDYFVEFIFENINLPFDDANNDGYIVFKIKTLDTLVLGDTFENNAEIYFDFNFPIITNFAETSIATLSTEEFELANNVISLYPNPTTHSLYIESKQTIQHITMYDISGRRIKEIAVVGTKTELTMSTEALSTGTYFVKIKTTQGQTVRKVIKD